MIGSPSVSVPSGSCMQHVGTMTCINSFVVTGLKEEDLEFLAEDGNASQAWVPLRIISKASVSGRLPSVIFLHATGAALFPVLMLLNTVYSASASALELSGGVVLEDVKHA